LEEFGWRPTIVTTHYDFYEEELDWELLKLVPESLDIIRTSAFPVRPVRIVGDVGVRAFPWHYRALKRLIQQRRVDFIHVTIPSNYTALLGGLLSRFSGVPYGIDFQDPWVHESPGSGVVGCKAWVSQRLAGWLEPIAVRNASLITGVAPSYYAAVLDRNPLLRRSAVTAAMPIGFSEDDFEAARRLTIPVSEFDPEDNKFHLVYAGTMWPGGYPVLRSLFAGVRRLAEEHPKIAERMLFHFIGTGKSPHDRSAHVLPAAREAGIKHLVTEHPRRMGYVSVLRHLVSASAILIIGSTEAHYTPSKLFQSVQSRKPVLGLLHEASTAVEIMRSSCAGEAITFAEGHLPSAAVVAAALRRFVERDWYDPGAVDWSVFERYSARESARRLAAAMDDAIERGASKTRRVA
jgi:hypothetical protein